MFVVESLRRPLDGAPAWCALPERFRTVHAAEAFAWLRRTATGFRYRVVEISD